MVLEQAQFDDIERYIAEPLSMPEVGNRKFAFLISGNEGIEMILSSHYTLPTESEDVFRTAVESIIYEGIYSAE